MTRPWPYLLIPAATVAAALFGGLSTIDAASQYGALTQPSWAPPSSLFGPVWTLLYIGIAVAGVLLWRHGGWGRDMQLWALQMAMNALWSPLFFALQLRAVALLWILVLDAVVLWLIVRTWRLRWPAWLLVPYLAWIMFATALNAAVWWLNR